MNNSEAHQTLEASPSAPIGEMNNNTTNHSETPLYDMFAKYIEQFIEVVQKKQYNRPANLANLANMFSFQLFLIFVLSVLFLFNTSQPVWILLLSMAGVACGFYSMATRDPLGMFMYSLVNFVAFVHSCFYLGPFAGTSHLILNSMSFVLLLLNQIKSVGYVIEFGKAKLEKRRVFESNI
ncbi:predicted protein [Naegleria gruberi]|uniref:Predicted protein n=1 Tax=Naegleria gruberi TaxID=5762 RepID=D2VUQ8_NAEGR|nr:uncharacterized protein NAEGRDRAFT_72750 [Naegleria gruberi]EFC39551.1 predicted protein [Naegleria gruberi]|eukprot:XP_002672295.1 predicted protein [Naegleria gruberi strain NEG-M]